MSPRLKQEMRMYINFIEHEHNKQHMRSFHILFYTSGITPFSQTQLNNET